MDCSRHLFEWMLEHRPDWRPLWMTRSESVLRELKARNLPVCHQLSPTGIRALFTARLAVISVQQRDIFPVAELIPESLRFVFLGHGKSGKASTLAFRSGRPPRFRYKFERIRDQLAFAVATSPYIASLASEANGFPQDAFAITGYPRNDEIIAPGPESVAIWSRYLANAKPRHTILYAPTWRQKEPATRFFPFTDFALVTLSNWLERNETLLLLRPHALDVERQPELMKWLRGVADRSPWIRLCTPNDVQSVNHLLPFVDVLVSDYSSIYHDYLLTDRPILLIPYDFDHFSHIQGFMYDYHALRPGPAIDSMAEFLQSLEAIFGGADPYRKERHALRSLVHTHTDAGAIRRVVSRLDELRAGIM